MFIKENHDWKREETENILNQEDGSTQCKKKKTQKPGLKSQLCQLLFLFM